MADFSALREFLAGYLHQDYAAEYGSPEAAARAFREAADARRRAAVAAEFSRFLELTRDQPFDQVLDLFTNSLGSCWRPRGAAALHRLLASLRGE